MDEPKQPHAALADGLSLPSPLLRAVEGGTPLSKHDHVRYYELVADWMLPHLKGRPVALVRGPGGAARQAAFPRRDAGLDVPGLHRLPADACPPGHDGLLEIRTRQGLIAAARMNVIAFHPWNTTTRAIDRPDRVVLDLDGGGGADVGDLARAARAVRDLLRALGLDSWVKTRDAKGLHVVVPIAPRWPCETVRGFARSLALRLAADRPELFVASGSPRHRHGRIFVDDLRNAMGATTVAAYSARARPNVGGSVPLEWTELDRLAEASAWTLGDVADRLAERGDPWATIGSSKQSLAGAIQALSTSSRTPRAAG